MYGTQLPIAIASEVDRKQLATWHPESGLTCCVITNLQKEFTVIIIDLFNPQSSVVINRQNVPSVYLEVQAQKRHKIGMATENWQIFYFLSVRVALYQMYLNFKNLYLNTRKNLALFLLCQSRTSRQISSALCYSKANRHKNEIVLDFF